MRTDAAVARLCLVQAQLAGNKDAKFADFMPDYRQAVAKSGMSESDLQIINAMGRFIQ